MRGEDMEQEQIKAWREAVEKYKETYEMLYNKKQPSEGRIESFCKIYKIPWPLPRLEETEEIDLFLPPYVDLIFGSESEG